MNNAVTRLISVTRPFAWRTYKGCKIIGSASTDANTGFWKPFAVVYWKRKNEKHLGFLHGASNLFYDRTAAEDYAIALALEWCDQNIPGELINAPR